MSKYKFTSVHLTLSKSVHHTNRETYAFLDWLGDVGGVQSILFLIGEVFVNPFTTYALNSLLVSKLVREKPSRNSEQSQADDYDFSIVDENKRRDEAKTISDDLSKSRPIKRIDRCLVFYFKHYYGSGPCGKK